MASGIYKITNIINGNIYIGSSKNIHNREIQHFSDLRLRKHSNSHLQRAYNKYGKERFVFNIVERCKESQRLLREQWYLDNIINWDKDYNISKMATGGGGKTGQFTQTEITEIFQLRNIGWGLKKIAGKFNATKSNISCILNKRSYKEFSKDLILIPIKKDKRNGQIKWLSKYRNAVAIGEYYNLNSTTIDKISKKENITEIPCREILKSIRKDIRGLHRKKAICQYTKSWELINCFESLTCAATTLNKKISTISDALKGRAKTAYGYKWKYQN